MSNGSTAAAIPAFVFTLVMAAIILAIGAIINGYICNQPIALPNGTLVPNKACTMIFGGLDVTHFLIYALIFVLFFVIGLLIDSVGGGDGE